MKIGIPIMGQNGLEDFIVQHFGRVPACILMNVETNKVGPIPNTGQQMGGIGLPPEFLL